MSEQRGGGVNVPGFVELGGVFVRAACIVSVGELTTPRDGARSAVRLPGGDIMIAAETVPEVMAAIRAAG